MNLASKAWEALGLLPKLFECHRVLCSTNTAKDNLGELAAVFDAIRDGRAPEAQTQEEKADLLLSVLLAITEDVRSAPQLPRTGDHLNQLIGEATEILSNTDYALPERLHYAAPFSGRSPRSHTKKMRGGRGYRGPDKTDVKPLSRPAQLTLDILRQRIRNGLSPDKAVQSVLGYGKLSVEVLQQILDEERNNTKD